MGDHFFVIGAQRSGTSYLWELLDEHPEIEMARPRRPEPKFFLETGSGLRREEYEARFFSHPQSGRVLGEKSTSYIESPDAARNIAQAYPDARIIALLRDPCMRAVSNYWFSVENGYEQRSADVALRPDVATPPGTGTHTSVSPFAYLERGRYADLIVPFVEIFGLTGVGVFLFEELVSDPTAIREIYAFLGVDARFQPTRLGCPVNASEVSSAGPSDETMARLRTYFREPNRRLEGLLGRSLAAWESDG